MTIDPIIPPTAIALIGEALGNHIYSHTRINTLFLSAGFPDSMPHGNCVQKCQDWLKLANLHRATVAPLDRLRSLLDEIESRYSVHIPANAELWNRIHKAIDVSGLRDDSRFVSDSIEPIDHAAIVPDDPARSPEVAVARSPARCKSTTGNVFIVHGHAAGLKNTVARFVEKLGLKSVILHEQPDEGRTIIEKLERHSDPDYVIVLCTPDDKVQIPVDIKTYSQPRPNVLLELGFFVGRLGREHVCVIVDPKVIMPSDFGGIVYISINSWQADALSRLQEVFELNPERIVEALRMR